MVIRYHVCETKCEYMAPDDIHWRIERRQTHEVFSMTDAGVAEAIDSEVPADCIDSAGDACAGCPVGAIEEA